MTSQLQRLRCMNRRFFHATHQQKIFAVQGLFSKRFLSSYPPHTTLLMPALSPTMEEGKIAAWTKNVGDFVAAGDSICEIETDKATVDFEMADDGFLAKILMEAGDTQVVKVGVPIGVIVEEESDIAAFQDFVPEMSDAEESTEAEAAAPTAVTSTPQVSLPPTAAAPEEKLGSSGTRIKISPLAKKLAAEAGIAVDSLSQISGTGPEGRIIAENVKDFISKGVPQSDVAVPTAVSHPLETETSFVSAETLTALLSESKKTIPHYFLNNQIDVTEILKLREELVASSGVELSLSDFLLKAAAKSMSVVPSMNASFREGFIREFENVHINVFTKDASETKLGLIKNVNSKGLAEISEAAIEIEESSLTEAELGTFSVINVGAFGVASINPIIVAGQSGCLGVGNVTDEIVVNGEDFEERKKVWVSLSCDHRVVDGAVGAQWMQHYKQLLENPHMLLL
eukprot:maker-scaffold_1-snap-gene-22.60-mRNA-1 protein AED:0.03 eAED:0.03 QI:324/1/1/1/0.6/0.5/6/388/455